MANDPIEAAFEKLARGADLMELREVETRIPAVRKRLGEISGTGSTDDIAAYKHTLRGLSDRRDDLLGALWPKAYPDAALSRERARLERAQHTLDAKKAGDS